MNGGTMERARKIIADLREIIAADDANWMEAGAADRAAVARAWTIAAMPVLLRLVDPLARLWSEWGEGGEGHDLGNVGDFTAHVDAFNAACIASAFADLSALVDRTNAKG